MSQDRAAPISPCDLGARLRLASLGSVTCWRNLAIRLACHLAARHLQGFPARATVSLLRHGADLASGIPNAVSVQDSPCGPVELS